MAGRVMTGAALVVIGALFLLGEFDVVADPGAVLRAWWPLVFVAIAVSLAIEQRRIGAGPLLFAGLGLVLLGATTDLVALDGRIVWPVLLIAVGAWLVLRPARVVSGRSDVEGPRIDVTAVFEDRTVRSAAIALQGGSLTSIFGDVDLDLRDAEPDGDATVDVTAIFGDVDLTVPADWRVLVSASTLFGDVDHRPPPHPAASESPLLRVRGFSLFGDVTVRQ